MKSTTTIWPHNLESLRPSLSQFYIHLSPVPMPFKVCTCFLVFIGFIIFNPQTTLGAQQIPCFFSFGDSLVDNGNNNDLNTTSKANYLPYGIDFPDGPTGRFTNGRTIIDIVAQLLGFNDFIPPFATASGQEIIKGINYGSGGAGIRDETGKHRGDNLSFNKQMLNHRTTISRIASLIGNETSARKHLSKCLYSVMIGSNDYINNYYLPQNYNSSSKYTPDQYAAALIQQYLDQLMTLYNYGARKLVLFGLGPLGCIPTEISMFPTPTCVDSINDAVQLFNDRLKQLVEDLNTRLSQAKLIYINVSSIQFGAPASIGLQIFNQPCCQVSSTTGLCIPGQKPCITRALNLFWDDFHPCETLNLYTAARAYKKLLPWDAYPTDISHLVLES